ncbi:PAS domain S-box protein [Methanolobus sp. ZRKC5]|uniref:PAS domain S-box protein n=1 Tax=unclassified Methanolobus TaxID=2629569 RepID=UPI00313D484B
MEEKLKESERKHRLLAENTLDSIWQLDENLVFTYANPATITITDLKSEDVVGTKLQDHFPENEIKKMEDAMKYSVENRYDDEFTKIETFTYDKNRKLVPYKYTLKYYLMMTGIFVDIKEPTEKDQMIVIH